jgi:hypothetical protein
MRKEYIPLAIIFIVLIALNVILDTFPLEGILSVGGLICILLYIGKIRTHYMELSDRVTQLEKQIDEKEKGEF